jgi:hypothetical protein
MGKAYLHGWVETTTKQHSLRFNEDMRELKILRRHILCSV